MKNGARKSDFFPETRTSEPARRLVGVQLSKQLRSSRDGTIFHIDFKPSLCPVGSNSREIFSMLYKSLVRPILEYACPVWSPYLVKYKLAIEKVQRRASRIALGQKLLEMSYKERCILLNWNTVQHQREYLSVVACYKTVFGLNGLDFDDYFEFCRSKNTKANHPYKIQTKSAKVSSFKYSFFVRIVKGWNSLPNHLFTDEINVNKF